jgi:hypothetical protein
MDGPINYREAAWEDLHIQDCSAGPVEPREAFDAGFDACLNLVERILAEPLSSVAQTIEEMESRYPENVIASRVGTKLLAHLDKELADRSPIAVEIYEPDHIQRVKDIAWHDGSE